MQPGANGTFIYVVKADATVEARPVQVGQENDGTPWCSAGLEAGERVVTSNQFRLEPGARGARAMSISEPFVRRPIATSLLMGGLLLAGLVAWPLLPVAPLPQVDFPTIAVFANLPGADPQTMASSVAQPLEYQFAQIPGLSQMTSTSTLGSTQITLQFDLNRNIDGAANDVQAAINAASRPAAA